MEEMKINTISIIAIDVMYLLFKNYGKIYTKSEVYDFINQKYKINDLKVTETIMDTIAQMNCISLEQRLETKYKVLL